MLRRALIRDRVAVTVLALGLLIALGYLEDRVRRSDVAQTRMQALLTVEPWYCETRDPQSLGVVASSVETFHEGGTFDGWTRLEDRQAGRLLLEFSYRGVWQFDDPWLTEAINEYRYLHVDEEAFTPDQLTSIETEFGEPEVSRVHALTHGQLVYGAHQSLYQCYRRSGKV